MLSKPHQDGQYISVIPQDCPFSHVSTHKNSYDKLKKMQQYATVHCKKISNMPITSNILYIYQELYVLSKCPHQLTNSLFVAYIQTCMRMYLDTLTHTCWWCFFPPCVPARTPLSPTGSTRPAPHTLSSQAETPGGAHSPHYSWSVAEWRTSPGSEGSCIQYHLP